MHGGAGALISVGLLKQVKWEAMEECVLTSFSSGEWPFHSDCCIPGLRLCPYLEVCLCVFFCGYPILSSSLHVD